jgi:hypothetical protein
VPLTVVCPIVGAALVVFVAWDITITLLHPTARGPLSYLTNRLTWTVARAFSLRVLGGRWLSYAGPLAVAGNLLGWVFPLWVGYALIYLPFVDRFSFDPNTPFGDAGFFEALYVSGTSLTTVGFGDVVATGAALRLATVLEAASGFGALSAAIAYVLSVYPLTTELRSTGLQLADYGMLDFAGAVRAVRESGSAVLPGLMREMTQAHEHLRRFPVLYYFESGDEEEPLTSLARGGVMLLLALRCADPDVFPHAPLYADMMDQIVDRLLEDLERDFVGGRRRKGDRARQDQGHRYDIAELCRSAGPGFGHAPIGGSQTDLAALLTRVEAALQAVAEEHGHEFDPLFPRT